MHAEDQKPIELLNTLIGVNNNRIECFQFLSRETDMSVLKILFSRFTETSLTCREELCREVYKLGGVPHEGTLATKEFFEAWQEVYSAATKRDRKAIINSCCEEEAIVVNIYNSAIKVNDDHITSLHQQIFNKQFGLLKSDYEKVHNLRQALAA